MREIVFVKKIKFNFTGSVTKKAIVIGDADNDQQNELVCGNLQGDLVIFKDRNPNRYAYATELGMVTASIIGDVINCGKNFVAAINTEGWLFIFDVQSAVELAQHYDNNCPKEAESPTQHNDSNISSHDVGIKLNSMYDQRMPANCKELLLADLDGDGQNEVIIGLTDRVLRTYKWIKIGPDRGKFVGLYKWEFADQIGAVSINPSRHENCQDIIVAQPGGTYAKLECFDKKPNSLHQSSNNSSGGDHDFQNKLTDGTGDSSSQPSEDNVRTEYISKLTPEYHQLALAQMRNHHISTEVLGGIRDGKNFDNRSLIVIATLDGTLMLVNKDEILWSLQVDHQLFALAIIETNNSDTDCGHPMLSQSESTCTIVANIEHGRPSPKHHQQHDLTSTPTTNIGSPDVLRQGNRKRVSSQYFVVCAWNGKTYIIDEERNYLRFKFDQAVSAFTAGNYHFDNKPHPSLVYSTFNNQIVLYYDVILDHIRPMYLLNEVMSNPGHADLMEKLEVMARKLELLDNDSTNLEQTCHENKSRVLRNLLQDVLYGVSDEELNR